MPAHEAMSGVVGKGSSVQRVGPISSGHLGKPCESESGSGFVLFKGVSDTIACSMRDGLKGSIWIDDCRSVPGVRDKAPLTPNIGFKG